MVNVVVYSVIYCRIDPTAGQTKDWYMLIIR